MKNKKRLVSILALVTVLLTGCASMERCSKDIGSDLGNGLYRTIEVYDYSGNLLKSYEGKIDIEETAAENKVKFDMNGKRYMFYNAIVIIEEK